MFGCVYQIWVKQIQEFYYDYIKNKCGDNSRLLLTDTNGFMYEIMIFRKILLRTKKYLDLVFFSAKSKYYDDSIKFVFVQTKDEVLLLKNLLD